jgi:hypothetical protein
MIFTDEQWARLGAMAAVMSNDGVAPMDENTVDAALPRAVALLGQTDLPSARIDRAQQLRAVINVEGNFFSNVDYEACFVQSVIPAVSLATHALTDRVSSDQFPVFGCRVRRALVRVQDCRWPTPTDRHAQGILLPTCSPRARLGGCAHHPDDDAALCLMPWTQRGDSARSLCAILGY